ncbi:hypothetical protein [Methanocella arvoryzae]|uniref:Uncharacterized protein n=1 Tax=Methanocella arvoryzae (strain DSM 22066 / NBRC 105507 / MRE50) TaxID=351160 RepID=Q0W7X9_METAR|nr:hypothetical protein [Methanocella arvoryzae]CAJ35514.1 hypothetical protein LRC589 [Methanocella arvoryzae MRE50]
MCPSPAHPLIVRLACFTGILLAACLLCQTIWSSSAAAQAINDTADRTCHIRGMVYDTYGTGVPGAEVRLMLPDGKWYMTPDNPVLSGTGQPAEEGSFDFLAAPESHYLIAAIKGDHNGSVLFSTGEGDCYVEVTLSGYVYRAPEQNSTPSRALLSDPVLMPPESSGTSDKISLPARANTTPDLWLAGLGGLIILAGVSLAAIIMRK